MTLLIPIIIILAILLEYYSWPRGTCEEENCPHCSLPEEPEEEDNDIWPLKG